MIGVGVAGHTGTVRVTADLSFASGFLAVTHIVSSPLTVALCTAHLLSVQQIFAYAGHVAFITFISEMKEPKVCCLFVLRVTL